MQLDWRRWCAMALLALAAAIVATPVGAAAVRCERSDIEVAGASRTDIDVACAATRQAIELLGRCGIAPTARMHLKIVEHELKPCGLPSHGTFDTTTGLLQVVSSNVCGETIPAKSAYAGLPLLPLYQSIIVHEITHAILWQNLKGREVKRAAMEYAAYAMQVHSMSPDVRDMFLSRFTLVNKIYLDEFNELILLMAPHHFAARAYKHFSASGNGCRILTGILSGKVQFPESNE